MLEKIINLKKKLEEKCNPKNKIDYCKDYWEIICPRTCDYALDLNKYEQKYNDIEVNQE